MASAKRQRCGSRLTGKGFASATVFSFLISFPLSAKLVIGDLDIAGATKVVTEIEKAGG